MGDGFEILAVDDRPANLEILTDTLSVAGYSVAAVTSGERALKRLQAYMPDLILLDIQMPGIDGFTTCQKIKENPDTASIPIIFITALSDSESIAKGFSLGAVDYISKPFQEPELLARVKTHLNLQSLNQSLEQKVAQRTAALQNALEELRQSRLQIVQQEKMSALGNLVAGVAHEINNPVGFLNGSISNSKEYIQELFEHLELYQKYHPEADQAVQEHAEDIDLDFLCEDLPKLLNAMQGATSRIMNISTSLCTFSRADTEHKVSTNLHEGLDSTLLILKYRLKANDRRPAIQVDKDYSNLPLVRCFPGQLNQVFMNLLANAIDVFDEAAQQATFTDLEKRPQIITVKTTLLADKNVVKIYICDNGEGMSEDVQAKIFDHLFTTKGVGQGTGLGLAIAYEIITEKHNGKIEVHSEIGKGSHFTIHLPID
ncbi:MAG: response regulator [Cyanobacteria bacterium P01_F01_bin.86]